MPELPEVEIIRRGLEKRLQGKRFRKIEIRKKKMVHGNSAQLIRTLRGNSLTDIRRRGKLLIFHLKKGGFLLMHLKMTGQLVYQGSAGVVAGGHGWPPLRPKGLRGAGPLPGKYTHIVFTFTDGSQLLFNDLRQFGYVELADTKRVQEVEEQFGVEPFSADFTYGAFEEMLAGRTARLKAVLLDQRLIAGLGNIYVDESCFIAGIRPQRRVHTLTKKEKRALYRAIPQILRKALGAGGTTFSNARRLLNAYGREGGPCTRGACRKAGAVIKKTTTAGRGTYYCPNCQK